MAHRDGFDLVAEPLDHIRNQLVRVVTLHPQAPLEHDFQRLFFEWGHPQVRDFCQERGLRYPVLDDSGEIESPAAWYASVREGTAERWRGVKQ